MFEINLKIRLNEEIDYKKKTKKILELKNTKTKNLNSGDGLDSIMKGREERISKLKERTIEIT